MKTVKKKENNRFIAIIIVLFVTVLILVGVLLGVISNQQETALGEDGMLQENPSEEDLSNSQAETGLEFETAKDAEIDFKALQAENPDVFAWLYIPGTDIDYPVLQSEESDTYYENHDKFRKESEEGAVYTELANMKNMCDFNTVLHGKGNANGTFSELYKFADPEFFRTHEEIYLYLEDNLLTYEVFAAFERDDTSLIRTYDFTYISGCEEFLGDLYGSREMGKNIREGWEDVTPYHFLITLTTTSQTNPDKQYVVVAALVNDAAGKIDRVVVE